MEPNKNQKQEINEVLVGSSPTPNPNAYKYIANIILKTEGKSSYKNAHECGSNHLAKSLFNIKGIASLHFFQNTITVTKHEETDWDEIEHYILETIKIMGKSHDPNYKDLDKEEERRKSLPDILKKIEIVLDETIRPSLQMDGGDLICVEFKDNILFVKYQGACGSCPSSTTGTLSAIKGILRQELDNPELDVYPIPY